MRRLIRIALYTRESTREQALNGYNLKGQDRNCRTYIENRYKEQPYTIKLYEEAGCSSKTLKRPTLQTLIRDIVNNEIDVICVYDILRLIRRIEHWFQLKPLFEKYNVTIISATNEIDLSTITGEIFFSIQLLFGQLEQDTIGKRTIDGLLEGAQQGYYIKGGKSSFGYKRVYEHSNTNQKKRPKLEVVEEEKNILRKMRDYLRSGYAPYTISLLMKNEPHLKSINRKFNENQVTRMLTDRLYASIMRFQDKEFILDCE